MPEGLGFEARPYRTAHELPKDHLGAAGELTWVSRNQGRGSQVRPRFFSSKPIWNTVAERQRARNIAAMKRSSRG